MFTKLALHGVDIQMEWEWVWVWVWEREWEREWKNQQKFCFSGFCMFYAAGGWGWKPGGMLIVSV